MAFSRTFDKRALESLIKRVDALDCTEILAGFFPEDQYDSDNDNLPVAQVAWYNERGLGMAVPSRPFMEKTFYTMSDVQFYARGMETIARDVLNQGKSTKSLLKDLGQHVVGVMQMNIVDWTSPPNSKRWEAIKGKNDPLIFTGKMLESVKYKVEKSHA